MDPRHEATDWPLGNTVAGSTAESPAPAVLAPAATSPPTTTTAEPTRGVDYRKCLAALLVALALSAVSDGLAAFLYFFLSKEKNVRKTIAPLFLAWMVVSCAMTALLATMVVFVWRKMPGKKREAAAADLEEAQGHELRSLSRTHEDPPGPYTHHEPPLALTTSPQPPHPNPHFDTHPNPLGSSPYTHTPPPAFPSRAFLRQQASLGHLHDLRADARRVAAERANYVGGGHGPGDGFF